MELACQTLGTPLDAALIQRHSGVAEGVYRNTKAALTKVLGVTSRATARDLCIQVRRTRSREAATAAATARRGGPCCRADGLM